MRLIVFLLALIALPLPAAEPASFDHSETIAALRESDAKAGRALYALHCASCHGVDGNLALNPLARRFARDELKFGSDPYSLWKTISYGNGLMFRWDAVLSAKERYQIVHHLREDIIKERNPEQYFRPDENYFEKLNTRAGADAKAQAANSQKIAAAPGMIDGTAGKDMNYGPFLQHAVAYGPIKDINAEQIENTTESAMIIRLSDDTAICYDTARLSISGIWNLEDGRLADTSETHHTSYKGSLPVRPSGEVIYKNVDDLGWQGGKLEFDGHYLHRQQVVLSYKVGERSIIETPGPGTRTFQIDPGENSMRVLVGRLPKGDAVIEPGHAVLSDGPGLSGKTFFCAKVSGPPEKSRFVSDDHAGLWFEIPSSQESITFTINYAVLNEFNLAAIGERSPEIPGFSDGGERRWPQTVQTAVARGENNNGYALDTLTVPLANPYGSWMRLSALDFFSDRRIAVSTLGGDVWIVSWEGENPAALTWSRFAAGLYEPLGLKIVDDKIYVRGRDRITRLHDLNNDGEADYYESFYADENEIGASYHAFIYDLQTDRHGNFYFSQSGYKSPLTGAVIRIDKDGRYPEFIGTDLRNPNGIGAGGPDDWITVADNPSGKAIYNGFTIARPGAIYGYQQNRNLPMLVVLPAWLDSSTSGQGWSDPDRWGPLSGAIVHGSWSLCAVFYTLTQDLGGEKFPNGFAVRFPWNLQSAPLRPRVHPADGQLYIAAQRGWDSIAKLDGAIYRIRATGQPSHLVSSAAATQSGIRLGFAGELDPTSIDQGNISAFRETDSKRENARAQPIGRVTMVDSHTIEIEIPGIEKETLPQRTTTDQESGAKSVRVNPAISLSVKLRAKDGTPIEQTIHATINSLP